jgi:hypothetical protein
VETVSSSSSCSSSFNMSISVHTQLFTHCKEVPNILLTKIKLKTYLNLQHWTYIHLKFQKSFLVYPIFRG